MDAHKIATGGSTGGTSIQATFHFTLFEYLNPGVLPSAETIRHDPDEMPPEGVLHCPTIYRNYPAPVMAPSDIFLGRTENETFKAFYSYAWNVWAQPYGDDRVEGNANRVNLETMAAATRTVAAVESYYWYTSTNFYFNRFGTVPHGDTANFLFYDGHVERLGRGEIPGASEINTVFWAGDNATNWN